MKFKTAARVFILAVLVLNLASHECPGQNLVNSQKSDEAIFIARTKQFSEFLDRFNYRTDFNGNPVNAEFEKKMPREKMLSALFDQKDPRITTDKAFTSLRDEFIKSVLKENILIEKYSPEIIAEARARVIYKGTPQTISIYLNQEVSKGSVKWVLLSARGDVLDVFVKDTTMVRFIPPASNETDFINLKRALEDKDHLQDYAFKGYSPDLLSIFLYCISSGVLKYDYVQDVTYHIFDIKGWYIKVKDFNRNELNSGWLITDISKSESGSRELLKSK
jgi:hypothetical protein